MGRITACVVPVRDVRHRGHADEQRPDVDRPVLVHRPVVARRESLERKGEHVVGVVEVDPLAGRGDHRVGAGLAPDVDRLAEVAVALHPECDGAAQRVEEGERLAALERGRRLAERPALMQVVEVVGGDDAAEAVGDDAQRGVRGPFPEPAQRLVDALVHGVVDVPAVRGDLVGDDVADEVADGPAQRRPVDARDPGDVPDEAGQGEWDEGQGGSVGNPVRELVEGGEPARCPVGEGALQQMILAVDHCRGPVHRLDDEAVVGRRVPGGLDVLAAQHPHRRPRVIRLADADAVHEQDGQLFAPGGSRPPRHRSSFGPSVLVLIAPTADQESGDEPEEGDDGEHHPQRHLGVPEQK